MSYSHAAPSKPKPLGPATPSLFLRVITKIRVNRVSGCWEWAGAYSRKRRGLRPVIQMGGKGTRVVLVSRLMCTWSKGEPPEPFDEAGHLCPHGENSRCINPDHLDWQSRIENERNKWRRA